MKSKMLIALFVLVFLFVGIIIGELLRRNFPPVYRVVSVMKKEQSSSASHLKDVQAQIDGASQMGYVFDQMVVTKWRDWNEGGTAAEDVMLIFKRK